MEIPRKVHILDYGAGNIRSAHNAVKNVAPEVEIVYLESPEQLLEDEITHLLFPGVGNFSKVLQFLKRNDKAYEKALKKFLREKKAAKFFGICIGMQVLFESSEEDKTDVGLGLVPGKVKHFSQLAGFDDSFAIPHIGWNTSENLKTDSDSLPEGARYYFVHSFCAEPQEANREWINSVTNYGSSKFISSIKKDNVFATQFHPEKSGLMGLKLISEFLNKPLPVPRQIDTKKQQNGISKRIVVCLDVRRDDSDNLVVTKGVGYNVRDGADQNKVRNLGSALDLAEKYYNQGCDELSFLSIKSFKEGILEDMAIQNLLKNVSEKVFVPLAIGGGIRDYRTPEGSQVTAVQVADRFFRCGADKVCIGSDAVRAVKTWLSRGRKEEGDSSIEQISKAYGAQAVVISVDSKRKYFPELNVEKDYSIDHVLVNNLERNGEKIWCKYFCTTAGGRTMTDLSVFDLVEGVAALGAGEIMLNCIDFDGKNAGFDLEFIKAVKRRAKIPLIASSGAGKESHFTDLFKTTDVEAGLGAGMFHREESTVNEVKKCMIDAGIVTNYR